MRDAIRDALLQFEEACSRSEHGLCHGAMTCQEGLRSVARWHREVAHASGFDIRKNLLERGGGEMPTHNWPTSTLLAHAEAELKAQPNLDSLRRATAITSALARLGERGLSVDCMVRTCIGPELLRHIIIIVANVWCDVMTGSRSREDVPELEGWLQALDDDSNIKPDWFRDRGRVILRSLQGVPKVRGEKWLREASLTHLLGWRLDDYMRTEVRAEDLWLPCGEEGTRWVHKR